MKTFFMITLCFWATVAFCATAADAPPASNDGGQVAVGTRTAQWLATQREGRAAGNLLPIPGAEAGLSYRRYLDSFARPIPDQLRPQTATPSGQK